VKKNLKLNNFWANINLKYCIKYFILCTFCIMDQQLYIYSELKILIKNIIKISFKKTFKVIYLKLETKWSKLEQVEIKVKFKKKTELIYVAK